MYLRLITFGFTLWLIATAMLRTAGQWILSTDHWPPILLLFAISFLLMAVLVRRVCQRAQLAREQWPAAAISLLLPTLLLDPFSAAFFPVVFPNMAPSVSGVFGGWMIICCAGGLVGATLRR